VIGREGHCIGVELGTGVFSGTSVGSGDEEARLVAGRSISVLMGTATGPGVVRNCGEHAENRTVQAIPEITR